MIWICPDLKIKVSDIFCKGGPMRPNEYTFASLIAIEGNQWHYHIPRFQREYVWGKYNWSKLLEDIYENDPGHYMGSIICVHEDDELSPASELIYEVVDGQQRLTTISLLLAAIYRKLSHLAKNDPDLRTAEDYIICRNNIKKRLIKDIKVDGHKLPWGVFRSGSFHYCLRVQPSTQGNNLEDYQYILKEIGLLTEAPAARYAGVRRIYKAYDYFYNHLPDNPQLIYDLLSRISALSFIHIAEASQSKAFMLFETLNYRGVPLSSIDIIKNKMLATLEHKHNVSINKAYDDWQKLLENLPEDKDQDRFLRQFYNAFRHDPGVRIEKINRATASNIIEIYEYLIKKDAVAILENLVEKAKIYNFFLEAEKYPQTRLTELLLELERIGAAPAYTFLLFLFSQPVEAFDAPDVKEKTVELLCKYYFRRNVTDFPNTRELDAIHIESVDLCHKELAAGRKLSFGFICNAILNGRGHPSAIELFREALSENLFDNNENMARYALAKLDEIHHSREYAPNLWQRNEKGLYIWTVEHVFPQGQNIPPEWVAMIGGGDREEAVRIQNEWVHSLGNLTLSGYNSNLSNQSFERKQGKTEATIFGTRISLGYRNGLALNNIIFNVDGQPLTLASAERWTEAHIKARNAALVDLLLQQFRFDNEQPDR